MSQASTLLNQHCNTYPQSTKHSTYLKLEIKKSH